MKQRLKAEGSELLTFCKGLKMQAFDGKYYKSDCLGHLRRFASYTVYTVAQCGAVQGVACAWRKREIRRKTPNDKIRHKNGNAEAGITGRSPSGSAATPRPVRAGFRVFNSVSEVVACACPAERSDAACIKTSTRHDLNP